MVKILPVMFGFFVMGFIDIIGIVTNNVKHDFGMTDTMVNLISLSCYFWFLILSIPTGMLMNKFGRKNVVSISFCFHIVALLLPFFVYNFTTILIAFSLIGIGNTLLQVSLNPLVTDVVSNEKLTGTLTLGQFIKAISSFLAPIIAAWGMGCLFGWQIMFPIYAALSLLALLWLQLTPIEEEKQENKEISFKVTFDLLKDKYIIAFFIGILVLVGVDVSINMTFPKFMMERCQLPIDKAGMCNSIYFFVRTLSAFVGGIILMKYSEKKFFIWCVWIAFAGLILILLGNNMWYILGCIVIFGAGYANLFSIIFALSLKRVPEKANEVSALLIVGIFGGAILPPILGKMTDITGTQLTAMIILAIVWFYMVWLIKKVKSV